MVSAAFFLNNYDYTKREFDTCYTTLSYLADLADHYGDKEFAALVRANFNALLDLPEE